MKCTSPKMKKWLSLYQFDLLPEEDKLSFEAHLLQCPACMEELYRFSPVIKIFDKMPKKLVAALEPRKTALIKTLHFVNEQMQTAKQFITSSPKILKGWWAKPEIIVIIPTALAILIITVLLVSREPKFSDLAIIEKTSYLTFRSQEKLDRSSAEKLFDEGMKFFQEDNYSEAIEQLTTFLGRTPNHAQGQFYLGVCLFITGDVESGINRFKAVLPLAQIQNNKLLLERCYWYLGNSYLRINKKIDALDAFKNVVNLHGDLDSDAQNQILKIREREKNKSNN